MNWVDPLGLQEANQAFPSVVQDYGSGLSPSPGAGNKSFIDAARSTATGSVRPESIADFNKALDALKKNPSVDLIVRRITDIRILQEALLKCDDIVILTHGGEDNSLGLYDTEKPGAPTLDWTKNKKNFQTCTFATCFGESIAAAAGKASQQQIISYGKSTIQEDIDELLKYATNDLMITNKACENQKKKTTVCVLVGPKARIDWSGEKK